MDITFLSNGVSSSVWKITTDANTYALRVFAGRTSSLELPKEIALRQMLLQHGLPVARPVLDSTKLRGARIRYAWCLDDYVAGQTASTALSAHHAEQLGQTLAQLHALPATSLDLPEEDSEKPKLPHRIAVQYDWAKSLYARISPTDDLRLTHGDLHHGNLMLDGDHMTLLDFGAAAISDPIEDLVKVFVRFDPGTFEAVLKAYATATNTRPDRLWDRLLPAAFAYTLTHVNKAGRVQKILLDKGLARLNAMMHPGAAHHAD